MSRVLQYVGEPALQANTLQEKAYRNKGIIVAILSGLTYGGYSAFVTQGMGSGIWADWYGPASALSMFTIIYLLSAVGQTVNDTCGAIVALAYAGYKGRLGDLGRSLKTKPGKIIVGVSLIGGPIAATGYVLGIQNGGPMAIPLGAMTPIVGALLGRFAYKQRLNAGMVIGVIIAIIAAVFIGGGNLSSSGFDSRVIIGMIGAICASIGWGIEGTVGGYACSMVDPEIAICIRQITAALGNGIILVGIFSILSGEGIGYGWSLLGQAFTDGHAMIFFLISGAFTAFSFKFWYKAASMCGAALCLGINATYGFWSPIGCFLLSGVIFHLEGYDLTWQLFVGALIMVGGLLLVAISKDRAEKKYAAENTILENIG